MANSLLVDFLLALSCTTNISTTRKEQETAHDTTQQQVLSGSNLSRVFFDSLQIGRMGICRVELFRQAGNPEDSLLMVFSVLDQGHWSPVLPDIYGKHPIDVNNLDPQITDYNNDGFMDFSYIAMNPGRGANEIRRLFIYKDISRELVPLKNAMDFSNLHYNPERKCMQSQRYYGNSILVEYCKIEGDSLRVFGGIEYEDPEAEGTDFVIDKNGKKKIVGKMK